MKPCVLQFVEWALDASKASPGSVLDVGSLDVNGNPRSIFERRGWKYTGMDSEKGPNVDVVGSVYSSYDIFEGRERFDCVVSLETLEHLFDPVAAVVNMRMLLRSGGLLILTAAGNGFPQHRHPVDCWRIMPDGMASLMNGMQRYSMQDIGEPKELGIAAWGIKG